MRKELLILLLLLLVDACAAETGTRPEPMGTVTGHVFCADTQRPARLANVSLVALPSAAPAGLKEGGGDDVSGLRPMTEPIETSLDGSFTLHNVKPGEYYLLVEMEGYVLPLAEFTPKQLQHPDEITRARMQRRLRTLRVVAAQATNEEVLLERGASVSGSVTYDDGSPAAGLGMLILTKGVDGKWQGGVGSRYRSSYGLSRTDDFGHYRMAGLPAGEYIAQVNLALTEYTSTTGPMPGFPDRSMTVRIADTKFSLPIYSGNVWRKTAAVAFSLGSGEQRSGADMQFPLSKLHKVTGQVLAKDGHAINGGLLTLLNADDKTQVTETEVQTADNAFHLEFVPEGDFQLKVSKARDVVQVQISNAPGYTPKFHEESKTVRTYGDAERELKVQGEASDVVLTVPDASKPAK